MEGVVCCRHSVPVQPLVVAVLAFELLLLLQAKKPSEQVLLQTVVEQQSEQEQPHTVAERQELLEWERRTAFELAADVEPAAGPAAVLDVEPVAEPVVVLVVAGLDVGVHAAAAVVAEIGEALAVETGVALAVETDATPAAEPGEAPVVELVEAVAGGLFVEPAVVRVEPVEGAAPADLPALRRANVDFEQKRRVGAWDYT